MILIKHQNSNCLETINTEIFFPALVFCHVWHFLPLFIKVWSLNFDIFPSFFVVVNYLVTEIHAGGWVRYLWDVEELQEILHLDGHRAGSRSNQSNNRLLPLNQQAPRLCNAPALALLLFTGHQCVPNKLNTLLERDCRVPAWVPSVKRVQIVVLASRMATRIGREVRIASSSQMDAWSM